ncbi:hypothetical protein T492DRAFT_78005 [Pavlovales sp. CCMP2436]|nr:hypothetical protein T492DRAFT_78005 [Pavlovales sp. CCMP2436]
MEDPFNTIAMIQNSTTIKHILVWYFVLIFLYNSSGVLVTYLLNSVWHAILDNFRPITVWGADLFIFYAISKGTFGEEWNKWSYLELAGLGILLFGTAVYNASVTPHPHPTPPTHAHFPHCISLSGRSIMPR